MDETVKQEVSPSHEKHNNQTFWQIYFPFLVVLALIGWAAYKLFHTAQTGLTSMRVWADISTMLIILPVFLIILLLILIVILIAALVGNSGDLLRKGFSKLSQIMTIVGRVCQSSCKAIQRILIETESYTSVITGSTDHFNKQDQEG